MKKRSVFLKILAGLAILLAILAVIISFRPNTFHVERTAILSAPPEKVFPQVNTLKNWEAWNPWAKMDPNIKQTYDGPASGTGAVNSWAGNPNVGEGRMTIVESRPNELVKFKLEFFKPFASTSTAQFTFRPEAGNKTSVTWSMDGELNFLTKGIGLFMSMDKMMGQSFEQGFTSLEQIVTESKPDPSATVEPPPIQAPPRDPSASTP